MNRSVSACTRSLVSAALIASLGFLSFAGDGAETRPFLMGFQDVTWDNTAEAREGTYAFLADNADIVCLKTNGGIPWQAALNNAYNDWVERRWRSRKRGVADNAIYLEIGPLDSARKGVGGLRYSPEFAGKKLDDPMIKKAYLSFVRREIEAYRPKYLGIGIEVNELYDNAPELWPGYVELHKHTYTELKKQYPDLPITTTFTLHRLLSVQKRGDHEQLTAMRELLRYVDFAGISFYPFLGPFHDHADTRRYWKTIRAFIGDDLPIAITETAYPAEHIAWGGSVKYPSNADDQKRFIEGLLEVARNDDYLFVIHWAHRDWDAKWERTKEFMDEMWSAWRDTGLLAGDGTPRPAYHVWKRHFGLPHARP